MTEARFLPTPFDPTDVVGWSKKVLDSKRYMSPVGSVVRNMVHGDPVYFLINDNEDLIQKYHAAGMFYEQSELYAIQRYFPLGGIYVDIGANIGNHALYVAKFLRPVRAVVFEPNPKAIEVLVANIVLNDLGDRFELQHLGLGIGTPGQGFGFDSRKSNLGATKLVAGSGSTKVITGDSVLAHREISLIKIDVEGMELQVLNSLQETIQKNRPNIMVEVDTDNRSQFQTWLNDMNYSVAEAFKRFRENQNFMIVPKPTPATAAQS